MAEIYIHIPGGEQLSIVPEASSSQDWALMGDNKLSLSFQRYECSILPAGAWCEFDGVIFYLLQEYKPTMIHSHLWQYNVAFVDGASWLGVTTALKTIDGEDAPLFTLTAPAAEHAAIIVSNLNRRLATTMWKVGSVIDTPNITIEYTGKYCGAVLQEIVDDQNTEWWVDGTTLNIGRAEFGSLIELGYRDGLLGDITVTQADNMSSYRTLYPVGSTRNILPTEYGHDRLQLPNGQKSVMMNPAGVAELVEEAAFAGIYPRYKGKVTGVSTSIGQSNDGSQYLIYYVADTAIPFNPNEYEMPGLVKRITFQSGELMGAEFEVNYNPASKEFELITQFQENGSQLPGGMLIPQVGDEYVVWNISMPAEYYPLAEQELLEAAESFAAASTRESNVYKVKLDYIDVQERGLSLRPGQKVRLHSLDYFPEQGYYDSRITRVTRPVNYPGEYTIDVSAVRVVGSLTRLQTSLAAATTKVNSLSNTVQTVVQTVSNAVTLTGNQRVKGVKDFVDGVRIGGLFASKLKDDTLYFDGNIVLRGGLTMYGKNTTTSPSIFSVLPIDGATIGRNEKGELCVIGDTGGGSVADFVAWSNVTNKPTWITDTKPKYSYSEILDTPDLSVYAIKSSVDNALSGKADKATTLAGYGITNAYTKSEVNNIIGSLDGTYVTIAGEEQSITAEHNFVNGFKVGGLPIKKSKDKTLYLDANLVVSGAITMYGSDSTTFPTIWANIPFDSTMKWNGSKWSVVGSSGSGSGLDLVQLEEYLTTNGYATQDWVTGRGYLTGITSSMVTTALGYTPLSTSGGTITGEVTITAAANSPLKINSAATDSGIYFNHNGVSKTWVGFEASRGSVLYHSLGSHRLGINNDGVAFYDSNTLLHSGNYSNYALPKDGTAAAAWKLANSRYLWGQLFDGTSNIGGQLSFNAGDFILVHSPTDVWTDGNGLTHPWYGIDFRVGGSYKGYISHWSGISLVSGNDITLATDKNVVVSKGKFRINQSAFDNGLILNRTAANSGVGIVAMSNDVRLGTFGINGTKTFEISGGNGIVAQVSTETGNAMITHGIGSYAEGIRLANRNGKTNTWSGIHLGCDPAQTTGTHSTQWLVGRNGNNNYFVVRNNTNDYLQIDLSGNLLIKGAITMYYSSDERLKKNIRKVNASEVLMSLGGIWQYEYIDSEVQKNSVYDGTHFGLIYQNVKGKSLDKMCHKREDGMGALNYVDADFISIIAGATMENISEVEQVKRENRELRKELEQLKQLVV